MAGEIVTSCNATLQNYFGPPLLLGVSLSLPGKVSLEQPQAREPSPALYFGGLGSVRRVLALGLFQHNTVEV